MQKANVIRPMKLSIIAQLDVTVDYITSGGKKIAEKNPKPKNTYRSQYKIMFVLKPHEKIKKWKKKKNDGNTDARAFSDIWRPHNSKFPLKVTKMRQSKTTF